MRTFALIFALFGILAVTLWWVVTTSVQLGGFNMPLSGWIAMILGVVLSIAVGVGLMALVFYSSRKGYDEPPKVDDD